VDFLADLGHERRKEFVVGRAAESFVGGKPALLRDERGVGGDGKFGVE
jgi:hypothetical protein